MLKELRIGDVSNILETPLYNPRVPSIFIISFKHSLVEAYFECCILTLIVLHTLYSKGYELKTDPTPWNNPATTSIIFNNYYAKVYARDCTEERNIKNLYRD